MAIDLTALLADDPLLASLARDLLAAKGARRVLRGAVGASTTMVAGALARRSGRCVLLVVAHVDDADEAAEELARAAIETDASAGTGRAAPPFDVVLFPALESLPGETGLSVELLGQRLAAQQRVAAWAQDPHPAQPHSQAAPRVLIAPIQALMQAVPAAASIERGLRIVRVGDSPGPMGLARWLEAAGYERADAVAEPGQFAIRGGIMDIFPPGDAAANVTTAGPGAPADPAAPSAISAGGVPVRLDFFGDQIDRISEIDPDTLAADRAVAGARLLCVSASAVAADRSGAEPLCLADLLPEGSLAVLSEVMELTEQGRGYYERVLDARDLLGPPAVFKSIARRAAATAEVTAIGQYTSGERPGDVVELPVGPVPPLDDDIAAAIGQLATLARGADVDGGNPGPALRVHVVCDSAAEQHRLSELLAQHAPSLASGSGATIDTGVGRLHAGFLWRDVLALPYAELLHRFQARRRAGGRAGGGGSGGGARLKAGRVMDTFLDLQVGDYVVHSEHGISRFVGLKVMRAHEAKGTDISRLGSLTGRARGVKPATAKPGDPEQTDDLLEYLLLEFDGKSMLYVPATKIDQVQKYVGGFRGSPPLSTIGGTRWKNQKERVADSVKGLAAELLRVRAARESTPGMRFPADTPWQNEFEAQFPYDETEDQLAALTEIKRDMASPRPMDRLLCGDVGYGKTELAIRAAFKAVEFGKQVAVLVPTTVLAEQHERTFAARFAGYPFRVESLSRFKSTAEVRSTLAELAAGRVDVVIGTHRLLSKDIRFADLGLVIVDEEQRFGVEHKERLLSLRLTADVLTLSATPIPRTLHMSMLGLRDISSLATAPQDRRAVVTEVTPYNPVRIGQAIARELSREGQVFFVHNRIHDIQSVADDVQRLAPSARIVIGHGQMDGDELERVMLTFMRRQADILVSTTIIESGIDIPTANTIIIDDADRFGLAELHQLRGRVGRGKHRGYCYLLLDPERPTKETAKKRLAAIEQYSMLGAGFKIAMRDLEIRGAGNILGPEQSGHIAAVGYDMYCQLLEKAVKQLRNEVTAAPSETAVDIGLHGYIPRAYIPSDPRRLEAYRRAALAAEPAELEKVRAELASAYGPPPDPVERLLQLAEIRIGGRYLGIKSITVREKDVILRTTEPAKLVARFADAKGQITALPVRTPSEIPEVYYRPSTQSLEPRTLLAILRKRLKPQT